MDWHRRVGLFMVVILFIVMATGFMMNHTDHLQLSDIKLTSPGLLKWYGLEQEESVKGFLVKEDIWFAAFDEQLYFNQQAIADCSGELLAALDFQALLLALCNNGLYLLTDEGLLLETITPDQGLPMNASSIGLAGNKLVVQASDSITGFDLDTLNTLPTAGEKIVWAKAETLPREITDSLNSAHITLEKLVQDIHSGRILGGLGIWLVDLSALLLLILTITGLWSWLRHRNLTRT